MCVCDGVCVATFIILPPPIFPSLFSLLPSSQVDFVEKHVMIPLRSLLSLFPNPLHLITKRHDKLLDYDHLQRTLEHADDHEHITQLREECLLARRNYDALNTQLLDELPHFLETCTSLVNLTLSVFLQGQYSFHDAIGGLLGPIAFDTKSDLDSVTTNDLKDCHASELLVMCKKLGQLSITPASLLLTGGITRITSGGVNSVGEVGDKVRVCVYVRCMYEVVCEGVCVCVCVCV